MFAFILALPFFVYAVPLVPCGNAGQAQCTLCDLLQLINNIINFILFDLLLPLAILGFLIGGIMIVTAGGSENQLGRGKSILWSTVIGIFIAFAAWLIVNTIINSIADPSFGKSINWAWNKFPECQ